MCGIVGIYNFSSEPITESIIKKMADSIVHRGPDDEGIYQDNRVLLGHRRLSIIDLTSMGHQPMTNENGDIWIVFNGEIYNYLQLNILLEKKGHKIRSRCDTETIIHCYEEFGFDCVHHLRGMFSFTIWDKRKNILFAAVDRLRIKPFYYTVTDNKFVFASELRAILDSGLYSSELNYEAIHHYLSMQAIPVPQTIFKNISTLPGGYRLILSDNEVKSEQYWDVNYNEFLDDDEQTIRKNVHDLLSESVEIRLMSDVPLGAFLSGGIDSSIIVALMSKMTEKKIDTYSIGYNVGGSDWDDTYYAKLVSQKFNTNHKVKIIEEEDILNELRNFIFYLDQPSTDAINSYFVSQLAAEDITVVLCGQGGDELFGGYNSFVLTQKFLAREKKWNLLPDFMQSSIIGLFNSSPSFIQDSDLGRKANLFLERAKSLENKYSSIRMELTESEKSHIYSDMLKNRLNGAKTNHIYKKYFDNVKDTEDIIQKLRYLELKVHLGDVLMRDVDVMSMAFSLETRIPIIDHKLVEYASKIPSNLIINNGFKKYIFIEAFKDLLPSEVLNREKRGFAFPLNLWLREGLRPLTDFVLSEKIIGERGLFDPGAIIKMKEDFYSGKVRHYRKIWGVAILEMWMRLSLEKDENFFEQLKWHVEKERAKML